MLRDGWVLNKWILPPNYWMTIWHKAKILMNHLFQFYQTVIDIFTSDWKDVTKVSQVVWISSLKSIFLYHATLLPLILSPSVICLSCWVLLRIQYILSHWKLTLQPHQTAIHTKSDHALISRPLQSLPPPPLGLYLFCECMNPKYPVKNMYWMANGCNRKP